MDFLFPLIAHAQATPSGFKTLMFRVNDYVLNPLIKLGFAIAILVFMWGVVQYIRDRNSGFVFDKDNKKSGNGASTIVWGLVGLFIMVSAFGIMRMIATLIGSDIQTP